MKCLNCGGTRLERFDAYHEQHLSSNVDAYVCVNCGHVEFFAMNNVMSSIANKIHLENQKNSEIKICEEKIAELERKLEPLRKQLNSSQEEMLMLKKASENEDITVKQQKELMSKLDAAKQKVEGIYREIQNIESQIECLKDEIRKLQK